MSIAMRVVGEGAAEPICCDGVGFYTRWLVMALAALASACSAENAQPPSEFRSLFGRHYLVSQCAEGVEKFVPSSSGSVTANDEGVFLFFSSGEIYRLIVQRKEIASLYDDEFFEDGYRRAKVKISGWKIERKSCPLIGEATFFTRHIEIGRPTP